MVTTPARLVGVLAVGTGTAIFRHGVGIALAALHLPDAWTPGNYLAVLDRLEGADEFGHGRVVRDCVHEFSLYVQFLQGFGVHSVYLVLHCRAISCLCRLIKW